MLRALSQKFNSLFLGIKWRFLGFTAFTPFPCFILRRGVSLYIKTVFHNQNGNRFFTKFYHTTKWKEYYLSSRSFCSKYHMLHLWVYILLFSLYHSWYFYLCIVVFFSISLVNGNLHFVNYIYTVSYTHLTLPTILLV